MRLFLTDYRLLPKATRLLIAAMAAGYVFGLVTGSQIDSVFGLVPARVVNGYWVWQIATYMFLHGGFLHAALNILMLWIFGGVLENSMGSKSFLRYFLIAGAGAALFNVAVTPHSPVPIIGASGAIFGLITAFAVLNPDAVVYLYFVFPLRARTMAIIMGVIEFAASFNSANTGIANLAHLGGMITGYIYLKTMPLLENNPFGAGMASRFVKQPPAEDMQSLEAQVNRILDKIGARGAASLSEEERGLMRKYSEKMKR